MDNGIEKPIFGRNTPAVPSHPTSPCPSSLPVVREGRRGFLNLPRMNIDEGRWDGMANSNCFCSD
jgi:hypothetical protein